jgi:alpha-tubulin suppressor-like RCC1 family protein
MFLSTKDGNKEPKKGTCMLGEGSTPQVPGQPIAWLGVANGQLHSLGLAANGTVYAWGSNSNGQLGTNNNADSPNPVAVTTAGTPMAGKRIIGVAAGHTSSYAIDESGTVYSWGGNSRGRLGDGTTTDRLVPVAVATAGTPMAGKKIISIAASYTQDNSMNTHVIALADDGTVYTWGSGDYGSLGRGSTASSSVPVAVTTAGTPMAGKKIISVAAGAVAVAAVSSDGSIFAWGGNAQGALGQRTTSGPSTCSSYACSMIPVEVSKTGSSLSGKQPVQVTATGASFAVLDSTGDIHFWSSSQLTPDKLLNQGDSTIRSISGDTNGSISGVTGSGSVYTWSFTLSTTKSPSKTTTVYYP